MDKPLRRKSRQKASAPKSHRPGSLTIFPEMKGRTVERIEVSLSSDYRCISIRFEDKTDFTVEIDTRLVCEAFHADWKTGNMRILKRWPILKQ